MMLRLILQISYLLDISCVRDLKQSERLIWIRERVHIKFLTKLLVPFVFSFSFSNPGRGRGNKGGKGKPFHELPNWRGEERGEERQSKISGEISSSRKEPFESASPKVNGQPGNALVEGGRLRSFQAYRVKSWENFVLEDDDA